MTTGSTVEFTVYGKNWGDMRAEVERTLGDLGVAIPLEGVDALGHLDMTPAAFLSDGTVVLWRGLFRGSALYPKGAA